jgi:hypothetical protein
MINPIDLWTRALGPTPCRFKKLWLKASAWRSCYKDMPPLNTFSRRIYWCLLGSIIFVVSWNFSLFSPLLATILSQLLLTTKMQEKWILWQKCTVEGIGNYYDNDFLFNIQLDFFSWMVRGISGTENATFIPWRKRTKEVNDEFNYPEIT